MPAPKPLSKEDILRAQRITKSSIFWTYESLKKRGIENDNREVMYNTIKDMTMEDLK